MVTPEQVEKTINLFNKIDPRMVATREEDMVAVRIPIALANLDEQDATILELDGNDVIIRFSLVDFVGDPSFSIPYMEKLAERANN